MPKDKSWWPLGLALFFVAISGIGRDIVFESLLMLSSRQAYAEVTDNQGQHNTCQYELQVDGKTYVGTGFDCGHQYVGASIPLYYWPTYPAIASTRRPGDNILTNAGFTALVLVLATLGVIFRKSDDDD